MSYLNFSETKAEGPDPSGCYFQKAEGNQLSQGNSSEVAPGAGAEGK